ncbi:MAG: hypothetical protein GKS00_13220 [Alphaproteobacteria bacterium]|nr:hypothetical protein [Alphaproteobacteria bacterium]
MQRSNVVDLTPPRQARPKAERRPTKAQRLWLQAGIDQPGGKLPLFDARGQRINERTIRSCLQQGWAEPWFYNPIKPDWMVCKLTEAGRDIVS